MAEEKSPQKHVTGVFGDTGETLDALIENSIVINALPEDAKAQLVEALKELPEEKRVKAIQVLQQSLSASFSVSKKDQEAMKRALNGVDELKKSASKDIERMEKEQADEMAESILKQK